MLHIRGIARHGMALDRAERTIDQDGRLRVQSVPLTKSNVCEYVGAEIPEFDVLGLNPTRRYRLYRDPAELAKAARSFNSIPLLSQHQPIDVRDHRPDLVVGCTGTDARFSEPFLTNSLIIWTQVAIDRVTSGAQRELSCGYRYRADMTAGTSPDGDSYEGVMRDIDANHVALVPEGRVGPDVALDSLRPRPIVSPSDHLFYATLDRVRVNSARIKISS